MLCVGLDTDLNRIPKHLHKESDPVFCFNKMIIDATAEFAVAYKPNTAFYEANGWKGWKSLQKTILYIQKKYPDIFTIADAKRGDIGNTSTQYAKAFFEEMEFDAITVAPYMGEDSVKPFLQFDKKWAILLALTSNPGAQDFQMQVLDRFKQALYSKVLRSSAEWGTTENLMFVVGATQAASLKHIRKIIPDHFLLLPGVGAQGGGLKEVIQNGMNGEPNLLINSSRGIIYASKGDDFAGAAAWEAEKLQKKMAAFLK